MGYWTGLEGRFLCWFLIMVPVYMVYRWQVTRRLFIVTGLTIVPHARSQELSCILWDPDACVVGRTWTHMGY